MYPVVEQLIVSAIISTVNAAVDAIQTKHKKEMLALWEIIKKSLLLRESPSTILPLNPAATPKAHPGADSLSKTITERWNLADLSYFDPHLDRAYGEGEIISIRKDMYYRNIVLFV